MWQLLLLSLVQAHCTTQVDVDGRRVPTWRACDTKPQAAVIALHGYGGSPMTWAPLASAVVDRGWLLAAPAGVAKSWNGRYCCGDSLASRRDDVGFLRAVVAALAVPAVAVGFSNGGFMVTEAAMHGIFRGVAAFSGYGYAVANSTPPTAILLHHGDRDTVVRHTGCCAAQRCCCGIAERWGKPCVDLDNVFEQWAAVNSCSRDTVVTLRTPRVTCVSALGCHANTTMCKHSNLGHAIPGLRPRDTPLGHDFQPTLAFFDALLL